MIQYKLIQEYPGHSLGEIHTTDKGTKWYGTIFYDANPKFWQKVEEDSTVVGFLDFFVPLFNLCMSIKKQEKVEEVDYEILSFQNIESKKIVELHSNNLYCCKISHTYNGKGVSSKEECLNIERLSIHSVKRLSDGEVFTIGDLIDFEDFGNKGFQPIDKIEIDCFDKTRITAWNSAYGLGLEKWKKAPAKTPLFTTEDGVDVFEGDKLYYILKSFEIHCNPANKYDGKNNDYKYFSTKEKAEEFVILNKPCLSVQELINIKSLKGCFGDTLIDYAKQLAKSKL